MALQNYFLLQTYNSFILLFFFLFQLSLIEKKINFYIKLFM